MRSIGVGIHRILGLFLSLFLLMTGLTGAVISWDEELDEWLNPHLHTQSSRGTFVDPLDLAARIEAADPRAWVKRLPLFYEDGRTVMITVMPRVDPATGRLFILGYNQVFMDPVSGTIVGKREWGKPALDREHLVSFLYKLHNTLQVPEIGGTDRWGYWIMGGIASLWFIDTIVALAISFPDRARWRQSFVVRWGGRRHQVNFDLHRAFGIWTWIFLMVVSFTAASLNMFTEAFRPALKVVSDLTPGPLDLLKQRPLHQPVVPVMTAAQVIDLAKAEAVRRGWAEPASRVFYDQRYGYYTVSFFPPGDDHGTGGIGVKRLYLHGEDGHVIADRIPFQGTAADVFVQLQFPVHSGRILGLPGRMWMSYMGLVVAALSLTGIVIWFKRRGARLTSWHRHTETPAKSQ